MKKPGDLFPGFFYLFTHVIQDEGIGVSRQFNQLRGVRRTVSTIGINPNNHWFSRRILLLQRGCIFEGVSRNYSVIVIRCKDHRRWVIHRLNVVQRGISIQCFELLRIITAAVICDPVPSDGEFLET